MKRKRAVFAYGGLFTLVCVFVCVPAISVFDSAVQRLTKVCDMRLRRRPIPNGYVR